MSNKIINWMDRNWYPGSSAYWDDEVLREEVLKLLDGGSLLDLGAGAGILKNMNFRGIANKVTGVDLDPRVLENPYLDEAFNIGGESLPFPDESFDLVVSDNVLEHLEDPTQVFSEVQRVLRPGGYFIAKTPNKFHYMPFIARITPHWFHEWFNKLRGRVEVDTFPTLYRANCYKDINALAHKTGFQVSAIDYIEGRPEYLRFNPLTYIIGFVYERLVNSMQFLSGMRIVLIIKLQKQLAD
jgi:SAM-dependent methyltransferase